MLQLSEIDRTWTLFLDRDGVINQEKKDDYVYHYGEFIFYPGVKEALKILAGKFARIILVTNQRGIGKGLMTKRDLQAIHESMIADIEASGGRIDQVYYCESLDDQHSHRKPNPGMAHDAGRDFPEIDFSRSVMVGNNISDMGFGRNAGMHTVFLTTTLPGQALPHVLIDLSYPSLYDFVKALQNS